jgi:hypothetical protein
MANLLYPKFKEYLISSVLAAVDVKLVLIDGADYTYNAAHEFLSDIPVAAREEISAALTAKTFTNGTFDAADTVWPAATGDPSELVAAFIDTGNPATSRLIAIWDTATGLPVTPNSGNINVQVNASGIFQLA